MSTTITLDQAGRMVLPKQIRDSLRVGPGDELTVTSEGDHVVLTPVRGRAGLQKKRGIWVYRSGAPSQISLPDLIDQTRQDRLNALTSIKK